MVSFPGSIPSLARPSSSTAMNATGYEGDVVIDAISDEVEAIATELGTDPAGAQATVKARLDVAWDLPQNLGWGSGQYGTSSRSGGSTTYMATISAGANCAYSWPFIVPKSVTVDRVALYVTTAQAGGNARLGMYAADDSTFLPTGSATDWGEVDCSGTGVKELTISQTLTGGTVVWLALLNDITSTVYRTGAQDGGSVQIRASGTSLESIGILLNNSATYASGFPAASTLTVALTGPPPVFVMRRT